MKKTISINISGIIFHIEEDGYDTLRKYLDSVNRYFASFEDSSEILADIESRIAEIFLSKLNEGKQVITAEDVNILIATMGSVNDFKAAEEKEFAAGEPGSSTQQEKARSTNYNQASKRLYRDKNKKILGGVCSGLGHYFNIDPVWPRLMFALLLFAYGLILPVYILLWILLPTADLEEEPSLKKMYRNPDKKIIGGVASGIAAFFATDLTVIRLLFVALTFFFGTGFFLYIILWIVLPEAKTITDKMKMQGEPLTLSNIESTVKKGLNENQEEESTLSKIILLPFRALAAVINALAAFLGPALKMIIDVIRVLIGLEFTLLGIAMILSLLLCVGIIFGLFHAPDWNIFKDWYLNSQNLPVEAFRNSFPTWTVVFTFLAAVIPAIFVLLLGISIMMKRLVFRQATGWSLFAIFFISAVVISFSIPQIALSFKEQGEFKTEQSFTIIGKTPVLKINEVGLDDYIGTDIYLKGYDGKEIKLVERFESQGSSRKVAAENAQMVSYNVVQNDSILTFDSNVTFKKGAMFKGQRLDIDVMIPYQQPFVVEGGLWRLIDTDIVPFNDYHNLNRETQTWVLTEKGLQCFTCPKPERDESISANDQFGFKEFNSIALTGAFKTNIRRGDKFAVELVGNESEKKKYEVYLVGETLVIEYKNPKKNFWKKPLENYQMSINISLPSLKEIEMTGTGDLNFSGFEENEFDLKLTGAVSADGTINAGSLNIKLTGASVLTLNGKGKFMEADIVGASGLKAFGYEVEDCIVQAHGASSAKVNVTGKLEMTEGIASDIAHKGNPEVIKR